MSPALPLHVPPPWPRGVPPASPLGVPPTSPLGVPPASPPSVPHASPLSVTPASPLSVPPASPLVVLPALPLPAPPPSPCHVPPSLTLRPDLPLPACFSRLRLPFWGPPFSAPFMAWSLPLATSLHRFFHFSLFVPVLPSCGSLVLGPSHVWPYRHGDTGTACTSTALWDLSAHGNKAYSPQTDGSAVCRYAY